MANIEYQAQRIKLAFNKATRQELFKDFGSYNARLRDILGSSDRLAGLRLNKVSSKTATVHSALWKFWTHANNVFHLLTEAWSCKCQASHCANLLLQHRLNSTVNFRVIFWYKSHLEGTHSPWTWQDTCIKLMEDLPDSITLNVPSNTSIPALPEQQPLPALPSHIHQGTTPQIERIPKSYRKSLMSKFKGDKPQILPGKMLTAKKEAIPMPATCAPLSNGASTRPKVAFVEHPVLPDTENAQNSKITNLCVTIATCSPELPPYGCLRLESRQYQVKPLCKAQNQPQYYVTLESLLSTSPPITISRRQRYHIALILASSHVQLHPTPWLGSRWSKKDVLFLRDNKDPATISIEQPYISRPVFRSPNTTVNKNNTHTFQDSIRNLGIMLLELCFGSAIEDHKLRRNVITSDEQMAQLINYAAATQWARDVVEEAGPEVCFLLKAFPTVSNLIILGAFFLLKELLLKSRS